MILPMLVPGMILGTRAAQLVSQNPTLRLSQLLEMYYSHRGVFGDADVRVCRRNELFYEVTPDVLVKEVTHKISREDHIADRRVHEGLTDRK